jgi:hypothetical protein
VGIVRTYVVGHDMIHPHTALRYVGPEVGVGVFATRLIPRGTIVWVQDGLDQVLEPEFVDGLDDIRRAEVVKYGYRDPQGRWILCWDDGRFVNHSFHANCIGTAWDLEIAVRDIPAGTELTDDYGSLNLEEPMDCLPEFGTDRTQALPDDLLRYAADWDRQVLEALQDYAAVEQPLEPHVRPVHLRRLRASVAAGVLADSIASIYFDRSSPTS